MKHKKNTKKYVLSNEYNHKNAKNKIKKDKFFSKYINNENKNR